MPKHPFIQLRPLSWSLAAAFAAALVAVAVRGQSREVAGTFVLNEAQAAAEDLARVAAIEAAAKGLPDEARFGLQARLDVMTRPPPRIEIQRSGSDMVVTSGDSLQLRSRADGTAADIKGNLELEQRVQGNDLVQTIEGDNLRGKISVTPLLQTRRYVPGARGAMTLETTLQGGDLAQPLIMRATYRAL